MGRKRRAGSGADAEARGGAVRHGDASARAAEPAFVFTRAAARRVDEAAIEEFGLPGIVLMENAARAMADAVQDELGACERQLDAGESVRRVVVVCGRGNNGGDGLAAARWLANAGCEVAVLLAGRVDQLSGDPAVHARVIEQMGIEIVELEDACSHDEIVQLIVKRLGHDDGSSDIAGVIVDALFGTGLDRPLEGVALHAVQAINAARLRYDGRVRVVAADVPSGLDADTGRVVGGDKNQGDVICADATVTFVGVKAGFVALAAQEYVGRTVVGDIGVPRELLERFGEQIHESARPGDDAGGHSGGEDRSVGPRPGS